MLVGAVGAVLTVTALVTPFVLPVHAELPTLRTQYVVPLPVGVTRMLDDVCPDMMLLPTVVPVPHW